jgi:energy-coupling factor transport system substrate-specific component
MNRTLSIVLALVVVLIIFLGVSWFVASSNPDLALSNPLMRFVFVIIGLLIAFAIYWFTRDRDIWLVGTREVVYMAIGAALYAIFSYLFNGTVFVVPSVSQVALRPAIVIPMFFGFTFGPVVGFFTGAVGNMFGDALTGFGLSPQWSIGNGLVGMIAGMALLFPDKRKGLNTILGVSAVLAVIATLFYIVFRNTANMLFFDPNNNIFGDALISPLAGLSVIIGFLLVLAVRYLFRSNIEVAAAVTWAMLGNIIGIGFAALSDIWINGFTLGVAIVGEFIPAAGPNLIFAAILLPILVVAYASVRRQSGR